MALAHEPDDVESQILSVVVLGSGLAETLGVELCVHVIVPQWCCLADDTASDVRLAVALHFASIFRLLPLDCSLRFGRLFMSYIKLLEDSHWPVRVAALESFLGIIAFVTVEERQLYFAPALRRVLADTQPPAVRLAAQRYLGPFIVSLLTPERIPVDLVHQFLALAVTPSAPNAVALHPSTSLLKAGSRNLGRFHILLDTAGEKWPWDNLKTIHHLPALCAYSFASVFAVVCNRTSEALLALPLARLPFSASAPSSSETHHTNIVDGLEQQLLSPPVGFCSASCPDGVESGSGSVDGLASAAVGDGNVVEYWWTHFRAPFLALVSSNDSDAESQVTWQRIYLGVGVREGCCMCFWHFAFSKFCYAVVA